jgi:glycosyltransferase involved in cell wall biosynthesis
MSLLIINCTGDTFTPTASGAIGTWIWEICRAAEKVHVKPLVISRGSKAEPYPWSRTILLSYPRLPVIRGTGIGRLLEIQRRLTGWGHVRQGSYASRIVRAIRKAGAAEMPMLLHNDPELAVFLRKNFRGAFIIHHFHNTNTCSERVRAAFAKSVNVVTAVSDYCANWNKQYFGLDCVHTVYNGVDSDRFSPRANGGNGTTVINFVGRTDAAKAPDVLLRAAKKLARRTKAFTVQILGSRFYGWDEPDEYNKQLHAMAEELDGDGIKVRRPGFISRGALPDELRKADIHVVPSRWDEPCALTLFEGMASGLPTIASRTGGTPEVIGDAGLLFERDGHDELADHLWRLISDGIARAEFALRARNRAKEFTWERTFSSFQSLMPA